MELSKEVKALSQLPWFPELMRELGYERLVRCGECWRRNKEDYCPLVIDGCYPPDLPDDWYCADGERRTDDPSHPFADDVMMGD